jgi:hypothetical protein
MTRLIIIAALAVLAGCATATATEVCGTTPEGDEFCAIYQVRKPNDRAHIHGR